MGQISKTQIRVLHEKSIPLLHASGEVFLGNIDHLIRLPKEGLINGLICRGPSGGLGATGQGENQLYLRMNAPQGKHLQGRQGIEPQGGAGKENPFASLIGFLQPFAKLGGDARPILGREMAMASKADAEYWIIGKAIPLGIG